MKNKSLLPIDIDSEGEIVNDAIIQLLLKISETNQSIDVFANIISVKLIASFDKFYNDKISLDQFVQEIEKIYVPKD